MFQKKPRESNIELFRIVTMLMIVAHHYVVNSGLINVLRTEPLDARSFFYLIYGAWGKTGINCFVLITGYFMCKSRLTVRRYLKLLLEVYFYRIGIFIVFLATGREALTLNRLLHLLLPFSSIDKGFTSCFLAFYLLIPFLNIGISHLSRKQHLALIGLLLLIYTIAPTIPRVDVTLNYVSWFVVIYVIGTYLRLNEIPLLEKHTGWKLLTVLFISIASIFALAFLSRRIGADINLSYYLLSDSNKPLALLTAVLAFLWFRSLPIGYHSWINTVASAVFGVLLIHANSDAMRTWLWRDTLHNTEMYGQSSFVLHAILSVIGVYIICTTMDLIRLRLIERPIFAFFDRKSAAFKQHWINITKRLQDSFGKRK